MSEWIKVSEMLPSRKKSILLWDRLMKEVYIGTYSLDMNEFYSSQTDLSDDKRQKHITHWQYAPNDPVDI